MQAVKFLGLCAKTVAGELGQTIELLQILLQQRHLFDKEESWQPWPISEDQIQG